MNDLSFSIQHEQEADAETIERLHERAFGPGRFARTAFRLREGGVQPVLPLCFTARVGTLLVGSIRIYPLIIANKTPALLLGPITIEPVFQSKGVGGKLILKSMEEARKLGHKLVFLVGDAPYYTRFGFKPVKNRQVTLPGPADPQRFLVCELEEGAFEGVTGPMRGYV